jgi:cysteine-rich repeat protein
MTESQKKNLLDYGLTAVILLILSFIFVPGIVSADTDIVQYSDTGLTGQTRYAGGNSGVDKFAQKFEADGADVHLYSVTMSIRNYWEEYVGSATFDVCLYSDSSGSPGAEIDCLTEDLDRLTASYDDYLFDFDSLDLELVDGTKYWIVVDPSTDNWQERVEIECGTGTMASEYDLKIYTSTWASASYQGNMLIYGSDEGGAVCGNGVIESPEACDDGDTTGGDGCSATCTIESGWDCQNEPSECDEDITCWEDCADGADDMDFSFWEECGVDDAEDYPNESEPFCPSVICYKDCDDNAESYVFDYGTTCGVGSASDYPLSAQPFCLEYYDFGCSEWYYFLCSDTTACTALGSDYYYTAHGCQYIPSGWDSETVEIDELNNIGNYLKIMKSDILTIMRVISFTVPLILFFTFFAIVFAIYLFYSKWLSND